MTDKHQELSKALQDLQDMEAEYAAKQAAILTELSAAVEKLGKVLAGGFEAQVTPQAQAPATGDAYRKGQQEITDRSVASYLQSMSDVRLCNR